MSNDVERMGTTQFLKLYRKLLEELNELMGTTLEMSTDTGTATGGSKTTLEDETKHWDEDIYKKAKLEIKIGEIKYQKNITGNTSNTLTFSSLPGDLEVADGMEYQLNLPISSVSIMSTVIQEDGETIQDSINSINSLTQELIEQTSGRAEIINLVIGDATGGDFKLGVGAEETQAIAYGADASVVESEINDLTEITEASVTKTNDDLYTITFTYPQEESELEIKANNLDSDTSATIELITEQEYKAAIATEPSLISVKNAIKGLQKVSETFQDIIDGITGEEGGDEGRTLAEIVEALGKIIYDGFPKGDIEVTNDSDSDKDILVTLTPEPDPGETPIGDVFEVGVLSTDSLIEIAEKIATDIDAGDYWRVNYESGANTLEVIHAEEKNFEISFDDNTTGVVIEYEVFNWNIFTLIDKIRNEMQIQHDEITGEEGGGEGRSFADIETIINLFKQQSFEELLSRGEQKEVYNYTRIYRPGYIESKEITIDDDTNKLTITINDNDKFDMWLPQPAIDNVEIQIAAGTYESGQSFVDAIITAIEGTDAEGWATVEWLGNDEGNIRFTANEIGTLHEIKIGEPNEHSALAEMGFDNFDEVTDFPADITRKDVIDKINDLELLINDTIDHDKQAQRTIQSGSKIAEVLTETDAVEEVLTFSENIESIEIYHNEVTPQNFIVNGITLKIANGGWRSLIGGTPSAEVTIPADVDCIVSRLE